MSETLKTTIDFETRSCAKIQDGTSAYARDESTDSLMLAYTLPGEKKVQQWVADIYTGGERQVEDREGMPEIFNRILEEGGEVHAHNAAFERYIWHHVMHKKYGWPDLPLSVWRCTAAKAAHANMPRQLERLCEKLKVSDGKDTDGKRLIKLLSLPQKLTKKAAAKLETAAKVQFKLGDKDYFWEDDFQEHDKFRKYNRQDVVAEDLADRKLPDWPESEQKVWALDRKINELGIPFDRQLCIGAVSVYKEGLRRINQEISDLTNGEVKAGTQIKAMLEWVNKRVNFGESLAAAIVDEWLTNNNHREEVADVVRILELRRQAGSTSISKYKKALERAEDDNRIGECLLYYGAATGRWAGRGIQPHNFIREKSSPEYAHDAVQSGDYDLCDCVSNGTGAAGVFDTLKGCARGLIKAPEGRVIVISDFAGIESRVLHWLCGNDRMLDLFRKEQDAYIESACEIYDVSNEEIATWNGSKWKIKPDHSDKRQVGKQAELGLGYGMGADKFIGTVKSQTGIILDPGFAQDVVDAWRDANPLVTRLWSQINRACMHVLRTKKPVRLGKLQVSFHPKDFLKIRLPSGRELFYYKPRITPHIEWGTPEITYLDGEKNKGIRTNTYGGKLVENVVQAISRDLLVYSMQIIDDAGMDIIFHVHDEVVVEVDENNAEESMQFVHNAMQTLPDWCAGLPLVAETDISKRYKK